MMRERYVANKANRWVRMTDEAHVILKKLTRADQRYGDIVLEALKQYERNLEARSKKTV